MRARTSTAQLLLTVTVVELALYRLAVPALQPPGAERPPLWHQALNYVGLFLFYFASALALAALVTELVRVVRQRELHPAAVRIPLVVGGSAFIAASLVNMIGVPTPTLTIWLESGFALALLALIAANIVRGTDTGAKLGLLLLGVPLLVHYYGVARAQFFESEEIVFSGLPERIQLWGQWSLVFVALVSPYCFAPRPFLRSAARLGPLVVGLFVGLIGAVILRQNYVVGMELAMRGLGIDIGPMAPASMIALYLMAAGALAWTLTATLTSPSPARRRVGIGIGLVFVGGYAFAWPLQYLVCLVGVATIVEAGRALHAEEYGAEPEAPRYRVPPIESEVWQAYVSALVERLRAAVGPDERATAVTVQGEHGATRTHVVVSLRAQPVRLSVERVDGAIARIDVTVGDVDGVTAAPAWTLHARARSEPQLGAHPEPPRTPAPAHRTGDAAFDARFRVRDGEGMTDVLLDAPLRERAGELLDGWLACWPRQGLHYRLFPGRGAPLDNPIPITELAFRGAVGAESVARMATLLEFLAELGGRAPR